MTNHLTEFLRSLYPLLIHKNFVDLHMGKNHSINPRVLNGIVLIVLTKVWGFFISLTNDEL